MAERHHESVDPAHVRWDLVDSYLAKSEADTPIPHREAVLYVATHPSARRLIDWIRSGGVVSEATPPEQAEAFSQLAKRLGMGAVNRSGALGTAKLISHSPQRLNWVAPLRSSYRWRVTNYAVVGAIAVVLGIFIGQHSNFFRLRRPTVRAVSTYATTNGERATITLVDGSTVVLNVASRLDVPVDFATGNRTVHLTGEALFTVSQHASAPFTVIAGSATARVLGTTFSVRHYTTDSTATVAVQDGKVAVGPAVITERRLVHVGPRGISQVQPALADAFSFATGTLSLGRMHLADAIPELNRWFDVDVRLGDAVLADKYFHGDFTAGSVSDLTSILELAFNARVVRDGRVLTLYQGSPK